uniref:Taste receptor type 2 member 40 n=1 Tax=Anolis carolinensis TaxID=28377 RepID=A0A803TAW7_ANOCA
MANNMSMVEIMLLIIFEFVSIIGILGNGFIIVVNGYQWFQNRKMIPCDFLLTSLSTSRFIMQLDFFIYYILYLTLKINFKLFLDDFLFFSWMFFNMISNWCATWLSVFYCVKVANFANPLFLWLKARINMLLPRLLGLSIWCNVTETLPENASQIEVCFMAPITFLPIQLSFYVINLCLSTIASILLLVSLWRHTRNLKKSDFGVKDLSTQVHIKVMAFLLFWIFFYFVDFIALIVYAGLNIGTDFGLVQELLVAIWMINMLVPRLFGLSISVFMVTCLPLLVDYFEQTNQREICGTPGMTFLPIQLSFYVINLCLSTIAIILLLASLWKHTRNLKKSGVDAKDLSTQVHIKVMTFLLLWLFFYLLDFIGLIVYTNIILNTLKLNGQLVDILMSAFSSAHPIILILSIPKLKETSACIIKKIYAHIINISLCWGIK